MSSVDHIMETWRQFIASLPVRGEPSAGTFLRGDGWWASPSGSGTPGEGTVTSVGLTGSNIFNITGSPITGEGTINIGLVQQSINLVFASPASGGAGIPTFRALVPSDIPNLAASKITSGLATVATTGSYLDLGDTPPIPAPQVNADWNAASGVSRILNKPILFSGSYNDLSNPPTIPTLTSQLTNDSGFLAGIADDSITVSKISATGTKNSTTYLRGDGSWATPAGGGGGGSGTVTSVALSLPAMFNISGSPVTTDGTLTAAFANQSAGNVLAAPAGSTGAPSFRSLVATDIPDLAASKITSGLATVATTGQYADLLGLPSSSGWTIVQRTTAYTAADNERVFCNTTSSAFSVTAPSGGGTFAVVDAVGTNPITGFYINNLTVLPAGGQTVMGTTSLVLDMGATTVTLQLVGTDWRIVGN